MVKLDLIVLIDDTEEKVKKEALKDEAILKWTEGKEIRRVIYVKGRLINIVV